MPYELPLPKKLKTQGWKVKILEKERVEPPHVTVFHKADAWRVGLRERELLEPPGGRWRDIDAEVVKAIDDAWEELRREWDAKYPENPISSEEEEDDDAEGR